MIRVLKLCRYLHSHSISRRCPRYIKQYNGIDDFACIGNELCPRGTYKSYEVYKYPACLNSSLYITEPTTTQADTTEQPSACTDCGDGGNSGQSVSCAVPVTIAVIVVLVIFSCLPVLEYHRGKFLLGMIYECLRNRCHDRVVKKDVEESHEGADVPMMEMMAALEADIVESLRKRYRDRVAKKDVQESHEGADVLMIKPAAREADMDVRPRNGSCRYSAADSPQGSQGGAAVQEGKAQGSPRLVDNIIEEI